MGVVRHVGGLLDGSVGSRPPELVNDGDLVLLIGRMLSDALTEWQLPVGFDAEGAARRVAAEPDVWTDGSLVSGASSAGAGCFTFRCSRLWADRRWGHLGEDFGDDAVVLFLVHCSLFRGLGSGCYSCFAG